jgi:hypothetical protein
LHRREKRWGGRTKEKGKTRTTAFPTEKAAQGSFCKQKKPAKKTALMPLSQPPEGKQKTRTKAERVKEQDHKHTS